MRFYKGDIMYSLVRSDDETSEGTPIFLYAAWDGKGQQIDAGAVEANCIEHAKARLEE